MTTNTDKPEATEVEDKPDYFGIYRSIRAGEKLQLVQRLNVEEYKLGTLGTAQLIAVAWKHRKTTTGKTKIADLLELTESELIAVLGLTEDELSAQIAAALGDDEDDEDRDDSKSDG